MQLTKLLLRPASELLGVYRKSAITASCSQCAKEGLKILLEGGSAVDAAITILLCAGVKHPARLGVGGGFVATIFDKKQQKVSILLARERAPLNAKADMFTNENEALFGGKATAVPGSLKGYWEMHQKYGKLSWKRLFEPALKMCLEGFFADPFTYYGFQQIEKDAYKNLQTCFVDPFSGKTKQQKRKIFRTDLAKTFDLIAAKNPDVLYNGELTEAFVKDIQNTGGIITKEDMVSYKVRWLEPLKMYLPKLKLNVYTTPPPCSGALLIFLLQVFSSYAPLSNLKPEEQWHRYIEVMKFAYGFRSKLGDPEYEPNIDKVIKNIMDDNTMQEISKKLSSKTSNNFKDYGGESGQQTDLGTCHINVISPDGDAICITETVNTLFGALCRSQSTGIILNNTMNDFSLIGFKNAYHFPSTIANLIKPGKIPLSSMLPTIVTNNENNDVNMLIGAAGGSKIISAVAQVLVHHLLLDKTIEKAIDQPRLHHQLIPMHLDYEDDFDEKILFDLRVRGHTISRMKGLASVSAISRRTSGGELEAKADFRRHAGIAGY